MSAIETLKAMIERTRANADECFKAERLCECQNRCGYWEVELAEADAAETLLASLAQAQQDAQTADDTGEWHAISMYDLRRSQPEKKFEVEWRGHQMQKRR